MLFKNIKLLRVFMSRSSIGERANRALPFHGISNVRDACVSGKQLH